MFETGLAKRKGTLGADYVEKTFENADDFNLYVDGSKESGVASFTNFKLATTKTQDPTQVFEGTENDDTMYGTPNADIMNGYGGNDIIRGLADGDIINGGSGNDYIVGDQGDDFIFGGSGDDTILGQAGNDTVSYTHLRAHET